MIPFLAAAAAATGAYLVFTATVLGWRGLRIGPTRPTGRRPMALTTLGRAHAALFLSAGALGYVAAGSAVAAVLVGGTAVAASVGAQRSRERAALATAHEAWPRLIEEIRVMTTAAGRSVPQALFEAGARAPDELAQGFAAAEREWKLTTDFERAVAVLKSELHDPTADAACETLLVAHAVGGADIDRRLAALAEDRRDDVQCRRDARAKQAGVRFARRFVLLVPLGMAAAGSSLGNGIAAYRTPAGLVAGSAGVAVVALCWLWSGRLLRLPDEDRVLA